MTPHDQWPDPTLGKIADGAVALRDCASAIRTRLSTREEELARLREQMLALREALAAQAAAEQAAAAAAVAKASLAPLKAAAAAAAPVQEPPPTPVPEPSPLAPDPVLPPLMDDFPLAQPSAPIPSPAEVPVAQVVEDPPVMTVVVTVPPEEVALDESPATPPPSAEPPADLAIAPPAPRLSAPTSLPVVHSRPSILVTALPVVCLIGTFMLVSRFNMGKHSARHKPETPPLPATAPVASPLATALDPHSQEALALVRQWRMAGDDKTVFGRLGTVIDHPDGTPAWSVEKLDEATTLVIFREVAGTPIYAFEVKLKTKTVLPSPEAVNRLTLLRVRDEAAALLNAPSQSR
ncbi:MAG: hypothetical protein AAB036_00275 [Elusimicrobiota bacterium]